MKIAEQAVETISGRITRISDGTDVAVPHRWRVYLACVALALVCNYVLGKDMAWDTLNYHLYLGFSALNDRFKQDYFAAGFLAIRFGRIDPPGMTIALSATTPVHDLPVL